MTGTGRAAGTRRRLLPLLLALALSPLRPVAAGAQASGTDWERTLDRVADAVVAIRLRTPRAFDTNGRAVSRATGFVVDAARGIVLTNRHVVQPGPVSADGVFRNQEEVELRPLYRDPVHDFGFFQYDPKALEFFQPRELVLAPERARAGLEIRVVGNDAGERISILSGTLARLDREAPEYGRTGYNDFNTFYYQAASGTSGGSSGSPVVDVQGRVVALNAGASRSSATSFYLPLERVVRALGKLRAGEPVSRGTLQTLFRQRPYDELRRLALRRATEAAMRAEAPGGTGALVVDEVVPGGPGDGALQPGDVLVRVAGRRIASFSALEALLDERVNGRVTLDVERRGQPLALELPVDDLHALSPSAYVEVGGGVVHELSYQQARNHAVPVGGVYVAEPGYALSGIPAASLIRAVDGHEVADLDAFERAFAGIAQGRSVPLRYVELANPRVEQVGVVRADRRWFPMRRCALDPATGLWPCRPSPAPPPPEPLSVRTARFPTNGDGPTRKLAPSLVRVEFSVPFRIDGVYGSRFEGAGLVVDAARGLVVVDRDTVPVSLGDLLLTFAGAIEVPGRVVYLHPLHNLAVVAYDPALLGDTPVRSAELRPQPLEEGDPVWQVGFSARQELVSRSTEVDRTQPLELPTTTPPRFRDANLEVVGLGDSTATIGGVLADKKGRVLALWSSFAVQDSGRPRAIFAGVPIEFVTEILPALREGRDPGLRTLDVELRPRTLAEARGRGLPEDVARELQNGDGRDRLLSVERVTAGAPAEGLLREGDLLLEIGGERVASFRDVERASQADTVAVRLVRDGELQDIDVLTRRLDGRGTDRALLWSGALLQEPHRALAAQHGIPPDGVYVSLYFAGSPAHHYGLRAPRRLMEVDGTPTPDLDAFRAAVGRREEGAFVRLLLVDLEGRVEVITLRPDPLYWPTLELRRTEAGWERVGPD